MEQAGRGLLEGLRAQSQPLTHGTMMSSEDAASPATMQHLDSKNLRDSGAQGAFTSTGKTLKPDPCTKRICSTCDDLCLVLTGSNVFSSAGVTLRGNSANRSGRRARRVSAGVSEDALATDSGVFEAWGRR